MNKCNFTLKHYKEIISLAKKKGYVFSDFFKKPTSRKRIYMRHDLDISLDSALRMAETENREGIKSTYFILIDSPYYNIFDEKCKKTIKRIRRLGHDIGIHYNWESGSVKKIEKEVAKQYKFLTSMAYPIKKIVSFHRPSKKMLGQTFSQFSSTYEPDFFIKTKYISDSNRMWREGCLCQFLTKSSCQNLQVLIHPIWWNEKDLSYVGIYQKLKKQKIKDVKIGLASDVSAYKNLFKDL